MIPPDIDPVITKIRNHIAGIGGRIEKKQNSPVRLEAHTKKQSAEFCLRALFAP
jgi:hypothetical protein